MAFKAGGKAAAFKGAEQNVGMEQVGDAKGDVGMPHLEGGSGVRIGHSMRSFCPNITNDTSVPNDVKAALLIMKKKDQTYEQCAGTTTIFGNKDCVHRQCYCITKEPAARFPADHAIFSTTEIQALRGRGYLEKTYRICHRHSKKLRIPFEYLLVLGLYAKALDEKIRGGIIQVRAMATLHKDDAFDALLDDISGLVPYLSRIGRQEAADARSSLKHAIDELLIVGVDERPAKKAKLERVFNGMSSLINGSPDVLVDTKLEDGSGGSVYEVL